MAGARFPRGCSPSDPSYDDRRFFSSSSAALQGRRPFAATTFGKPSRFNAVFIRVRQRPCHRPRLCSFRGFRHLIDGSPQLRYLAIQFHLYPVEMPIPVPEAAHPAYPLTKDVADEYRTEPVTPMTHRLMAFVGPAFEPQALGLAQRR